MPAEQIDISDLQLGHILGAGTVGTIYAAEVTDASKLDVPRRVAVKMLHESISEQESLRARFKREVSVLGRLEHPNVISCYGSGETDGQLYYVMDRIDGGTVADLLEQDGPIAWPVVIEIGCQICSALQHAHNNGVVHRDLKPSNLFLTLDGLVKLGDFGIARDLQAADISAAGQTVGTHAYMAPEQITGDLRLSGKADLYSLGCCLFEMLSARKVFGGAFGDDLLKHQINTRPQAVSDVVGDCPKELGELIGNLLEKSPESRPFNARAAQGKLTEIAEHLNVGDTENSGETAGRKMLRQTIQMRSGVLQRGEASFARLAVAIVVVAVIVGLIFVVKSAS